jgi:hypothetical protein
VQQNINDKFVKLYTEQKTYWYLINVGENAKASEWQEATDIINQSYPKYESKILVEQSKSNSTE